MIHFLVKWSLFWWTCIHFRGAKSGGTFTFHPTDDQWKWCFPDKRPWRVEKLLDAWVVENVFWAAPPNGTLWKWRVTTFLHTMLKGLIEHCGWSHSWPWSWHWYWRWRISTTDSMFPTLSQWNPTSPSVIFSSSTISGRAVFLKWKVALANGQITDLGVSKNRGF